MQFSVDETWLPRYVNLSTNFGELTLIVEKSPQKITITLTQTIYIYIYINIYIYICVCVCVCFFGLVLWHINHCRLFNAKSIFIQINSSIPNNSV